MRAFTLLRRDHHTSLLARRRYWRRLGKNDARRGFGASDGRHPAADELDAALGREVQAVRLDAAAALEPMDQERHALHTRRQHAVLALEALPPVTAPSERREARAWLAAIDEDRARLDVTRAQHDDALAARLAAVRHDAERADAAYRAGHRAHSRLPVELPALELTLADELKGPIPDPVPPPPA